MSRITPIRVGQLILEPLKYFFHQEAPDQYRWDPDDKKTKIDISMINDARKATIDHDPVIVVDRGGFEVNKVGLSDNLSSAKTMEETKGLMDRENFLIYNGQATIIVKSRNEGTVEVISDMVIHVLQWSRPHIADLLGFKEFALPMSVSAPALGKEATDVYQVQITVPWSIEERWSATRQGLKLRDFIFSLSGSGH